MNGPNVLNPKLFCETVSLNWRNNLLNNTTKHLWLQLVFENIKFTICSVKNKAEPDLSENISTKSKPYLKIPYQINKGDQIGPKKTWLNRLVTLSR